MISGRLDEAGPVADGQRLGLRRITDEGKAAFIEGNQLRELIAVANIPEWRAFIWNRLVVLKEAVLDFARRHQLPPPSWWADGSGPSNEQTSDAHLAVERQPSLPDPLAAWPPSVPASAPPAFRRQRGPKPKKLEQVKEAMRGDLQRVRYTKAGLQAMLEKELAVIYGVSRDTARKARNAVLSEIVED
jgi:hypothetical protein